MSIQQHSSASPLVSIGMPVFNGGEYLELAIESVLEQSHQDLELVISDNASTDSTEAICRSFAEQDERVRFVQSGHNRGASWNFNHVLDISRGQFFRWMAADDVLEATCIERCVDALNDDPGAILAHTNVRLIDASGKAFLDYRYKPSFAGSLRASQRFLDVMLLDRWCTEIFSLMRIEAMRSAGGMRRFVGSDRILRAELALLGRYAIVDEFLFLNRDHPDRLVRALPSHHMRAGWFDTTREGRRILPHWRILFEYLRSIRKANISALEQLRCVGVAARWLTIHMNFARLIADVIIAVVPAAWKPIFRASRAAENWLRDGP